MICSVHNRTKIAYNGEIAGNRWTPEHKYDNNTRTPTFFLGCCGFLLNSCEGRDKGDKPFFNKVEIIVKVNNKSDHFLK